MPRLLRSIARTLGSYGRGEAEFLSYLFFDPVFTSRLVQLGREDGIRRYDEVAPLLGPAPSTSLVD